MIKKILDVLVWVAVALIMVVIVVMSIVGSWVVISPETYMLAQAEIVRYGLLIYLKGSLGLVLACMILSVFIEIISEVISDSLKKKVS